jgi:hypothetical protein
LLPATIARAGRWLLTSGIQEPEGGVARYYRSDLARYNPISTEITGYAAGAFVFFHQAEGDAAFLDAARRAAGFLTTSAWNPSLATFPFEIAPGSPAYFFDIGIIVRGLLTVWRATGDAAHLETARRGGVAMRDFDGGQATHPILELPSRRPHPYGDTWSKRPGCYQLKAAMAWRELAGACGDETFLSDYERALERALADEASFLPGESSRERVVDRLHAYCYFLEGLLPMASHDACRRVLESGIARVAALAAEIAPLFSRSDVFAQLLRLRLIADRLGAVALDEAAAGAEAEAIAWFQRESPDPRVDGGFSFGRRCGAGMPFVNPASTVFAAQALALWHDRASPAGEVHHLI